MCVGPGSYAVIYLFIMVVGTLIILTIAKEAKNGW